MTSPNREIAWIGSSHKDLKGMPAAVQDDVGFALWRFQEGKTHHSIKPLKGLPGVLEIVTDYQTDTFRAVYAAKLGNRIYVLHVFKKKSKRGIATPREEMDVIKRRLQDAQRLAKEG